MAISHRELRLRSTVAGNLRAQAARLRLTQEELGALVGLTQFQVSRRLSGKHPITVDELEKFAEALGITAAEAIADAPTLAA